MSGGASHVAIDLGAGSGRAMLGRIADDGLRLRELHRFHYGPRPRARHLRWDLSALLRGIDAGLATAALADGTTVTSVGACSWGVDYGLVDADGRLVEEPIAYRDERTHGVMEEVFERVPREELYARTGIQFLPFNTLYQLASHARAGIPGEARLLMIPDLCHRHLCGREAGEITNVSTTQMWSVDGGGWDRELIERVGIPAGILPEVVAAGTLLAPLRPERRAGLGGEVSVVTPATHDTGSAVAGTPLNEGWAYVSSGTWSLVGVEIPGPILSPEAARHSFTNEAGALGTVRFLKNVMGLWILEGCRREWSESGAPVAIDALLDAVATLPGPAGFVYPDDPRFLNPPSMVGVLQECLRESGQAVPQGAAGLARVVLDSLALRYAAVLDLLEELTGRPIPGVHVMGGGSLNDHLNQATANAAGRPVLAGPVEATAAGNVIVQALAVGEIASLAEGRRLVAASHQLRRFEPDESPAWREARRRYVEIEPRPG